MTVDELRRRLKAVDLTPREARHLCWIHEINVRQLLKWYERVNERTTVEEQDDGTTTGPRGVSSETNTPPARQRWPRTYKEASRASEAGLIGFRDITRSGQTEVTFAIFCNGQTRRAQVDERDRLIYLDPKPAGTRTTTRSKKSGTRAPRRAYLPQAARDWLARLRREGECGLWTITQNIVERIVMLPPRELAGYLYMRGLALNEKQPGCFWISHEKLSRKLGIKLRRAKQVTKNLREWNLIGLKRRGAGLYGTANYYSIRPLTQDLLDGLLAKVHSTAPTRVHSTAPHRLSSKERASASARLAEGSARSAPEGVERRPLRLIRGAR